MEFVGNIYVLEFVGNIYVVEFAGKIYVVEFVGNIYVLEFVGNIYVGEFAGITQVDPEDRSNEDIQRVLWPKQDYLILNSLFDRERMCISFSIQVLSSYI